MRTNEPCCLEEAPWRAIFHYTGLPKAERCPNFDEVIASSNKVIMPVFSLFRDVQDVVKKSTQRELPRPTVLLARALKIRQDINSWRKKNKYVCENVFIPIGTRHTSFPLLSNNYNLSKRFEPRGICLVY